MNPHYSSVIIALLTISVCHGCSTSVSDRYYRSPDVQRQWRQEIRSSLHYESSLPPADTSAVAVLAFDNYGTDRTLDPLGRGLAEMITTDLSKVRSMKIVERLRMQTIVDELSLSGADVSSPLTRPRAGRIAGAQRIITGSFAATDDGMLHIDASVTNVPDAVVEAYATALVPKENLFRAEKKLVLEILRSLSIPVTDDEREAILSVPTEHYFAFVRYAQGLESEDRGLYAKASEYFREALMLDPGFIGAKDRLEYTDALFEGSGTQRGKPAGLPPTGDATLDTDAITNAGERAASTLTETTGGYAPGFTAPVKANPVLIRRALPAPPSPPKK